MSMIAREPDGDEQFDRERLVEEFGEPVVLNLGSGTDDRGIGIDINYDPDIRHDLNDGIPVADDSVDKILCLHVLEHLENPAAFLREAKRVLRDDGELRVELPNVGWLPVRLWMTQDMHRFWEHKEPDKEGHWLARRLGNDDEKRTSHKTLWTRALIESHLEAAGFEYEIDGGHWARNLVVRAVPGESDVSPGQTLHELERASGDDMAARDYWARTRATIMASWVAETVPRSVVDVGCGSGYLTAQVAAENPQADVVGIDQDPDSIAVGRRRDSDARFEVGDAFDIPASDSSTDCVIYGDVLEHFENPAVLLEEAHRILSDDGSVIVSVPAFRTLRGPHDDHNGHEDRFTKSRLGNVASQAGFHIERARYTNAIPLLPYFVLQRVLQRPVPGNARGGHSRVVEALKNLCVRAETEIEWPAGITLIAELRHD